MKFSIFKNLIKSSQETSLVIGIFEEDIDSQFKELNFIETRTTLLQKLNYKKFTGEKGQIISFDLVEPNSQPITFIGIGNRKNIDYESLKNTISDFARKVVDKQKKVSFIFPWSNLNTNIINQLAETIRLSTYKDNRYNSKKNDSIVLDEIEFIQPETINDISFKDS